MSCLDVVEKAIDKRLDYFYKKRENVDCIDKLIIDSAIGALEDLKNEII